VVTAPVKRELVRQMVDRGLSERRAGGAVRMSASAFRYEPRPDRNVELRETIQALAQRHKRYGVGMIHLKLRQAGLFVNYKRVERLYQEAKLQVRRRKRKKVLLGERQPLARPTAANQVWSMDFVFDRTAESRVLKCLTIVDDATHESVAIEVERAISGYGVARVLDRLAFIPRLPQVIRSDNGKEFCGKAMLEWAHERGVPATDRARQAEPERLHRKLQRPVARRVPQRALVHQPAARPDASSKPGDANTTRSDRRRRWAG
jgi:putative transposase